MATIGELLDVTKEFEWKIDNFFSLSGGEKGYLSPSFSYADESWCLLIFPNGAWWCNSTGHIGVRLCRQSSGPPISLTWTLSLKTSDGRKDHERQHCSEFYSYNRWGHPNFLERSTLLEKKSELVPSDVLTLVCSFEYFSKTPDADGEFVTVDCSYCEEPFHEKYVSLHEQKCLEKPIRCLTCGDVVELRKLLNRECQTVRVQGIDHECQTVTIKANEKLVEDLAGILENEEHSDVTVNVKDEEFRLHRIILAGRNPYFSSMFKSEMKEKSTGIVSIDDCEPDIFRSFVRFLYTGQVEDLSGENVCDLYRVADKYQADQLKAECLYFMRSKMSTDNFCDFIVLALGHDEKELLQDATELFCRETKEIIKSVKWQNFMKEYSTQANELYLKAIDFKDK